MMTSPVRLGATVTEPVDGSRRTMPDPSTSDRGSEATFRRARCGRRFQWTYGRPVERFREAQMWYGRWRVALWRRLAGLGPKPFLRWLAAALLTHSRRRYHPGRYADDGRFADEVVEIRRRLASVRAGPV